MKGAALIIFCAFALALGDEIEVNELGCPTNYTIFKALPHDTYCNLYYTCNGGLRIESRCPVDLVFNSELEVCDWPFNVDCAGKEINNDEPEEAEPLPNPGGNNNPSEAPEICAEADSDGVLVAHEDCDKFYKCDKGLPVAMSCYTGLVYNSNDGICDYEYNVDCGDRVVPTKAQMKRAAFRQL